MKRNKAEQLVKTYLDEAHTVLWLIWDVSPQGDRAKAVKEFLDILEKAKIISGGKK